MNPIIALTTLGVDQLTKFLAAKLLSLHETLPLIKGFFHLTLVYNRGAAFGMLKDQLPLFIGTSLLAILLIIFSFKEKRQPKIYFISLSLILGGACGNLIDRLRFGYVIDFLDFRIWPVFNVADSAVTIGAILLGICILKSAR